MRLLSKTSLLIITVSIFIFFVGNIGFFHLTKRMIIKHVDNELINNMHNIIKAIKYDDFQQTFFLNEYVIIDTVLKPNKHYPSFADTVIYSELQKKYIPHRVLKFNLCIDHLHLEVFLNKSLLSSDKLIEKITFASIIMVVFFIVVIFALNRFIFENVWSIFFINLKKVDSYDINTSVSLNLEESEIEEFNQLNRVHEKMVERIEYDFTILKELTANTSHEIQTPLAIIRSKAELLLQSENLSENELNIVNSIIISIDRLSKLNKSLLLITKIENNQFSETVKLNIKDVLDRHLQNFNILFEASGFNVNTQMSDLHVKINAILLDVLIQNLLKNALTHGEKEKNIEVFLKHTELRICNKGSELPFPSENLFKRFVKSSNFNDSSGLGLEIVSKICSYFQINLNYSYENSMHCFCIDFSNIADETKI